MHARQVLYQCTTPQPRHCISLEQDCMGASFSSESQVTQMKLLFHNYAANGNGLERKTHITVCNYVSVY
jgi:hypothetical protein